MHSGMISVFVTREKFNFILLFLSNYMQVYVIKLALVDLYSNAFETIVDLYSKCL